MGTTPFLALTIALTLLSGPRADTLSQIRGGDGDTEWFRKTEQSLMDAIAVGDRSVWDRVMDERCVATTEEGRLLTKQQLIRGLTGLPPGLSGVIKVDDLSVDAYPGLAIVTFLADEQERVFGQLLNTKYRITDTFRHVGAEWKLVATHQSVVTADPPAQDVVKDGWSRFAGDYQLVPDGWIFHVVLRDGSLFGGRDAAALAPLVPMASNAFVRRGVLGELIFISDGSGNPTRIVDLRKFQPLIWTRAPTTP
jgi:hypothetical protein